MADQQEWAKLWFAALSDEEVLSLPPAKRWAWAAMIAYTKKHGTNGTVMIRPDSDFLAVALGVPKEQVLSTINGLPNLQIGDAKSEHGLIACSFTNWYKYQVDSTHAERQKRARYKRREEERRREEKRINTISPMTAKNKPEDHNNSLKLAFQEEDAWLKDFLSTQQLVSFREIELTALLDPKFWEKLAIACHGIDRDFLESQFAKMGLWLMRNPKRRPTRRFISNWICKAGEPQ